MAKSFAEIAITAERRLCVVKDRVGYFHGWDHYSDVIEPSLLKGGHVEFTLPEYDNEVTGIERVSPLDIVFIDFETAAELRNHQDRYDGKKKE